MSYLRDLFERLRKIDKRQGINLSLISLAILVSFIISNMPVESFVSQAGLSGSVIVGIRALLFFISAAILFFFFLKDSAGFFSSFIKRDILIKSFFVFFLLMILSSSVQLASMGREYGQVSIAPFAQHEGFYYRRILMPALANFLQFQGPILYNVFHFLVTFLLIYTIIYWLKEKKQADFNLLQLLSIFCAGFVMFQFQMPGYTEQGVLLACFLSLMISSSSWSRIAALAIMFLFHEGAAIFVGIPFALMYFPKKERPLYLAVLFLFLFSWGLHFRFDLARLFLSHTQIGENNNLYYFLNNPKLVLAGVFFAYKFLWLYFAYLIFESFRTKDYRNLAVPSVLIAAPFITLPLVDVSRDISWGYMGILLAVVFSYKNLKRKYFNLILALNLLLPSVYVGANTGFVTFPGIYRIIIHFVRSFLS